MKIKALMKAILRTIGKLTKGALEPVIVIAIMITFTVLSVYFPVVELIMVGVTLLIMLATILIIVWVFISSIIEEYEEEVEEMICELRQKGYYVPYESGSKVLIIMWSEVDGLRNIGTLT